MQISTAPNVRTMSSSRTTFIQTAFNTELIDQSSRP